MSRRLHLFNKTRAAELSDVESKMSITHDAGRDPYAKVRAQRDTRKEQDLTPDVEKKKSGRPSVA